MWRLMTNTALAQEDDQSRSHLAVGFVLLPHFTLLPFAAFIDALLLEADETDAGGSRKINCTWTVIETDLKEMESSCVLDHVISLHDCWMSTENLSVFCIRRNAEDHLINP